MHTFHYEAMHALEIKNHGAILQSYRGKFQ
jgi:hypothetical protein